MKRTIIAALLLVMAGLSAGCCNCGQHRLCGRRCRDRCHDGCGLFRNRGCGIFGHHGCGYGADYDDGAAMGGGPPTAQVTYPYYTTRGPRDYLADNPRGIGP